MAELFSKEALAALDDHSEAEEMARVSSPRLIVVLAAMLAMVIVALYWCIFGTISYKVNAQGVVFPFAESSPVSLPYDGTVARVIAVHGQSVAPNDALLQVRSALAVTTLPAGRSGVVLNTLPEGAEFKAREAVAWIMPQTADMKGREMLCYVSYKDLRKLEEGMQVQTTPADLAREKWGYAYGHIVGMEQFPTSREEVVRRLKLDPLATFIKEGDAVYEVRVLLDEKDGELVWSRKKSAELKVGTGSLCNIQIVTERKPVWRVLTGAVDNSIKSARGK